jgi:hypothetical protein
MEISDINEIADKIREGTNLIAPYPTIAITPNISRTKLPAEKKKIFFLFSSLVLFFF